MSFKTKGRSSVFGATAINDFRAFHSSNLLMLSTYLYCFSLTFSIHKLRGIGKEEAENTTKACEREFPSIFLMCIGAAQHGIASHM
ncbi:hypothetical protein [Variovorax sp. OV700]|uniref:hypothetical protein n=1 Tax=Variovorax sp. OV700 TaxID=1882826 RepID=UPI0011134F7D|nr:hypothetical protein [Variovorax sp. OV700]